MYCSSWDCKKRWDCGRTEKKLVDRLGPDVETSCTSLESGICLRGQSELDTHIESSGAKGGCEQSRPSVGGLNVGKL